MTFYVEFYATLLKTENFFQEEPSVGGKIIVFKSDADKTKFAKTVVPYVEKEYFEVFRPMFEFIKSKCGTTSSIVTNPVKDEQDLNKNKKSAYAS